MRYFIKDNTLIIEGSFSAISSGLLGGWKRVECIFNHSVDKNFDLEDPIRYIKVLAKKLGINRYFGLLTSVPMDKLSIVRKDEITAFVTAGVKNPNEELRKVGTINIILVIEADLSDGGMVNAVITATEAKSSALLESGFNFTGTNTDAVVVAKTSGKYFEYAGPASELGRKIWFAVKKGVKESLSKW